MRCDRRAIWFPIVPDMTSTASSLPVNSAMNFSNSVVVVSSLYTSSINDDCAIACSIERVGVVIVSVRKSKAAGPELSHDEEILRFPPVATSSLGGACSMLPIVSICEAASVENECER